MKKFDLDELIRWACEGRAAKLVRYEVTEREGWLHDVRVWVDQGAEQVRSYLRDRAPRTYSFEVLEAES